MAGREGAGGGNQYVVSVKNFNFFPQVKLGNTTLIFILKFLAPGTESNVYSWARQVEARRPYTAAIYCWGRRS